MFLKGQLALLQSFFAAALYDDQLDVVSVDVALFFFLLYLLITIHSYFCRRVHRIVPAPDQQGEPICIF